MNTIEKAKSRPGRDKLLAIAREQFTSRGYANVSMQQIADAAGMTKGAPYYHFRNKEELFLHVSSEILADLKGTIASSFDAGEDLRARLVRTMHDVIATMSGDLSQWFIDFRQTLPKEQQMAIVIEAFGTAEVWTVLDPLFERAVRDGEMQRVAPGVASRIFLMLVLACVDKRQFQDTFEVDAAEMIDEVVDVFLHGVV